MKLVLLALALLLAACSGATPAADPRVQAAAMNEAERLNATATTQAQEAYDRAFNHSQTETALPFAVAEMERQAALADIAVTQAWDDATATASVRATEAEFSAIVIPTKIAAVGTALSVQADKNQAELESARSMNNLIGLFALGFLGGLGIGFYWLLGRARADVKRRNTLAVAKPEVVGGQLVLPPGYTSHTIVASAAYVPALAAPVAIEERTIGGNVNGQPRSIAYSQPVNEHEKIWREFLGAVAFVFQQHGFSSDKLCGRGRPFASTTHWTLATDILAANGLILKEHGQATLVVGKWGDVIARIQDATHPLKLPKYLPPHLRVFDPQNMR